MKNLKNFLDISAAVLLIYYIYSRNIWILIAAMLMYWVVGYMNRNWLYEIVKKMKS